jgi:hypothetical protein
MKFYLYFLLIPVIIFSFIIGCKTTPTQPENTGQGGLTISGLITDNTSSKVLSGAAVAIIFGDSIANRVTDTDGKFIATISVTKSVEVEFITSLKGYYTDTTFASVVGGQNDSVHIKLQQKTIGTDVAGPPASIVLVSTSAQSIGVKETGSVESALITFEVQDSSGNAINIDHSTLVNFSLGSSPGGGEYINPTSAKTDANGQVIVSISSGTKAGVVQFVAQINSNGKTIVSKPVNITIHGGHPDKDHLTIYPKNLNVAGWHIDGNTDEVIAIVGDKYANPVKPLTATYFTTTGGIIEGSALTDNDGEGQVQLITGNPYPVDPVFGPGFATVTVYTADENYNTISDTALVLFSGASIIAAADSFPEVPYPGEEAVQYTIKDVNGNPIASGNKVGVSVVQGSGVSLLGDINFYTIDTQNKNATSFSFKIENPLVTTPLGRRVIIINIDVSGPNGADTKQISGFVD